MKSNQLIQRIFSIILSITVIFNCTLLPTYAAGNTTNNAIDIELSPDDIAVVTVECPIDNNSRSTYVHSTFYVRLSPHVSASNPNQWEIIVSWSGTSQIEYLIAKQLLITNTSALYPQIYHSDKEYVNCHLTAVGSQVIGYCIIPEDVDVVKISMTGVTVSVVGDPDAIAYSFSPQSYTLPR